MRLAPRWAISGPGVDGGWARRGSMGEPGRSHLPLPPTPASPEPTLISTAWGGGGGEEGVPGAAEPLRGPGRHKGPALGSTKKRRNSRACSKTEGRWCPERYRGISLRGQRRRGGPCLCLRRCPSAKTEVGLDRGGSRLRWVCGEPPPPN